MCRPNIRVHHQLVQWSDRRSGCLHGSLQPHLDSTGHEHPCQRLALFQRSAVDELFSAFLPLALAVEAREYQLVSDGAGTGFDPVGHVAVQE